MNDESNFCGMIFKEIKTEKESAKGYVLPTLAAFGNAFPNDHECDFLNQEMGAVIFYSHDFRRQLLDEYIKDPSNKENIPDDMTIEELANAVVSHGFFYFQQDRNGNNWSPLPPEVKITVDNHDVWLYCDYFSDTVYSIDLPVRHFWSIPFCEKSLVGNENFDYALAAHTWPQYFC